MAKENIKAFFEALSKDETIQKAMKEKELGYTGSKEDREAVIKAVLIPVAEEAGYTFTLEELKELEKGMREEGELAENELESVAGGTDDWGVWGVCFLAGIGGGGTCVVVGFGFCFINGWGNA